MITGLYANGFPHWNLGPTWVPHIVAVYGFSTDSGSSTGNITHFHYVDANPPVSGHWSGNNTTYAPYHNVIPANNMWIAVLQNNASNNWQIW
jgi:hypothetical protein